MNHNPLLLILQLSPTKKFTAPSYNPTLNNKNITIIAKNPDRPFQKRSGSRSNNGGRILFKKSLLGWRRSCKNSDN